MKKQYTALVCALLFLAQAGAALAQDGLTGESLALKVSRVGDLELSCAALSQEAMLMKDIVATTQGIKDESNMQKHGITAAGTVGSLLVGTMTGGIGLAAAGFLLDHNVDEKSSDADSIQDIAEQRRSLMMGIHTAKGCYGPLEHALIDPAPATLMMELAAVEPAAGDDNGVAEKPHYNP